MAIESAKKLAPAPLLSSRAAARHRLARCILVRPAMRLTKHDPATRRASGGAPRSKGPYSMRCGYHLSSSCGGAERPSSAAYAPPVQHGGDQTCSQRAPCTPPPLVATATASSRSMANATAASGTFNRVGVGTDTMPTFAADEIYATRVATSLAAALRTRYVSNGTRRHAQHPAAAAASECHHDRNHCRV